MLLRQVLDKLDGFRDILNATVGDWKPPIVVVLVAESTGKSTLMERLTRMSIFPRDKMICTRVPIYVRLRNAEKAQAPTLSVQNVSSGRIERGPITVVMQRLGGEIDVSQEMDRVLQQEHRSEKVVASERIIVVEVKGPKLPFLDLVDLPGVVQSTIDLNRQTVALVERYIAKHGFVVSRHLPGRGRTSQLRHHVYRGKAQLGVSDPWFLHHLRQA